MHSVDEADVMERAQAATELMLERTGLRHLLEPPATLLKAAHYSGSLPHAQAGGAR